MGKLSIDISNFKSILSFSKIKGIDTDVEILNGQMAMCELYEGRDGVGLGVSG